MAVGGERQFCDHSEGAGSIGKQSKACVAMAMAMAMATETEMQNLQKQEETEMEMEMEMEFRVLTQKLYMYGCMHACACMRA
jgi:hypothetical protein